MLSLFGLICCLVLLALPASAASSRVQSNRTFDPLQHLGGQSPYFSAPAQYGITDSIPDGCKIDQAAYLVRHGSRFPTSGSYAGWVSLFRKLRNASFTASGPLAFLPSWAPPLDDPDNQVEMLSGTGAKEAFDLGVRLRYLGLTPSNEKFTVWAASQQRCVDTAQWFLQGYLSRGHYDISALSSTIKMADSVNYTFANSLTPTNSCPRYAENDTYSDSYRTGYRPAIASRLNEFLNGVTLDSTDVGIMMDLCGFQTEIAGYSPFCGVFTEPEWMDFEYAMDLQYYWGSGPGNPLAGATFWPYLKAVADLFEVGPNRTTAGSNSSFVPPPLLVSFTHDNDIAPLIAALNLLNESSYAPLNPTAPDPERKFRSSYAITFAGRVALERISCTGNTSRTEPDSAAGASTTFLGKYVRARINDAVVPLQCAGSADGLCPLPDFILFVAERGGQVGDYVSACGQTATNATSSFTAFVDPSSVL